MLRHFISQLCDDWDQFLAPADFDTSNTVNPSVKIALFMLNLGRHPGCLSV